MSDDARFASAHHAGGVPAPPMSDTRCWTRRTKASGFDDRHALQHRWAARQLPGSYGEPPRETGTTSSTTPCTGERLGSDGSMGSPQIQHGSPLPSTRRLNASRRWPFERRGFEACGMCGPLVMAAPPGVWHPCAVQACPPLDAPGPCVSGLPPTHRPGGGHRASPSAILNCGSSP